MRAWVIISKTKCDAETDLGLYWSNACGWVLLNDADTFTIEEKDQVILPIDGEWTEQWIGEWDWSKNGETSA